MRRFPVLFLSLALASASIVSLSAFGEDGPAGGPPPQGGPADGNGPPHGPPGGVHLIPPFAREKLNLTADQQQQLAALEKDVTEKVNKILTPEQQKTLAETRPPRPRGGQGGGGGPGGGGPGGGGPGGGGRGAGRGAGGDSSTPPPPDGMGPPQ